ncbi:hypothetical protein CSUI_001004 [Cystoisospora suis]|uniref:SRS domain-containing protein n=1 Tax=Cystoisospora suis TaxID=483139 RepID=A0A2C6LE23_9APIC|nr:hypothetical protein CSUI_001004 [Cystoisospora suis]
MRFSTLRWRPSVFIVASALAVAAVLSLFVDGKPPSDGLRDGPTRLYVELDSPQAESDVKECGKDATGREAVKKLELTGKDGLRFKCATTQTLGPLARNRNKEFLDVYEYDPETKGCNVTKPAVLLSSLVEEATLTMATAGNMARDGDPVYTLNYRKAPKQDRSLCYTCNASPLLSQKLRASDQTKCVVHITVKAEQTSLTPTNPEEEGPPSDGDGTGPPSSSSSVRAITASVATAAGGILAMVFLS